MDPDQRPGFLFVFALAAQEAILATDRLFLSSFLKRSMRLCKQLGTICY